MFYKILMLVGLIAAVAVSFASVNVQQGYAHADVKKVAKIEVDSHIPDGGVLYIPVRQDKVLFGEYVVDTRFDLCFFVTRNAVVEVSCDQLEW